MPHSRPTAQNRPPPRGFSLIELMIAVAIVGILAGVAFPAFMDSVRKGRRSEAFAAITSVQQAQERWRSNHATYTTTLSDLTGVVSPTPSGYYTLTLANPPVGDTKTGYTATATAAGSQTADGACKLMGASVVGGGNIKYGSGTSSIDWSAGNSDPKKCWAK